MASEILPVIYLARHGETAWSVTGQHTGLTDLPLTERGERNALRLGKRLAGLVFAKVLTSPLQRAVRTCELAGFGAAAAADPDLVEWNYGDFMKAFEPRRFMRPDPTGNCSATVAQTENRRSRLAPEPIVLSVGCAPSKAMY